MSFALALSVTGTAIAAQGFLVKDIKVLGLQRVSRGTVLNYLPVQVGERMSLDGTGGVIRALYDTGFFQSVSVGQEGSTLVIEVIERATIGAISVTGNSELPAEKLKELLKELGLVKGLVFQRSSLERIEKELKQAYLARGKYNAIITTKVVALTENRVDVAISISEGRVSRIKEINIIGSHAYSSSELSSELSLSTRGLLTYFTKKDQYSKEALEASIESLKSFYMDRGYLKFKVVSSQVMLSPDKRDVFINIHIYEGPQYHFAGYDFMGHVMLPREKLDKLVLVHKGDIFSRKVVTDSISAIGLAYGDIGYGFPTVNAEPRIDDAQKTIFITFMIDPGRHVYVRRINFHGNTKTADYVLRNVMRQNEGSMLSLHNIKESERQLRQLTYLKNINVKTTAVQETNNQVDLDVYLDEAPSAEGMLAIGYGTNGPNLTASLNQYNFMGTGRKVGLGFNASYWGENYNIDYYNPFYGANVGRGFNLYYQRMDPKQLNISAYTSDRIGGDVNYDFVLNDYTHFQAGFGYQDLSIHSVGEVVQIQNFVNAFGRHFQQVRLFAGWNRNTYDQLPYPTRGWNQQLSTKVALPAEHDSLSYYQGSYETRFYQPLVKGFILTMMGNVSYGNTFNNQGLPFYENYYAGGIAQPGQVRGFDSYSLGPQDNFGNSLGANFLTSASAGLILPYPFSRETVRTTLFADAGNVFARNTPPQFTGTASGPLRYSAGISVEWRSPFGPLAFNLASPLNRQPGDSLEPFQFSVSSGF